MLEDVPELEVLPIPIGGGGLIAGMATAAKHVKPEIKIVGLEPAMYPSFTARMRGVNAGVTTGGATIAEGIAVKQVGDVSYSVVRPLVDEVLLIEEPFFERAVALYCNDEKRVTEGAGAGALAALLAFPEKFRGKSCGLVITGGNIDTRLLASVLTRELVREQRIVSLRIIGDDRPGLLGTVSAIIVTDGQLQHQRGGPQPAGARCAGQGGGVRSPDRDARRPTHPGNHGRPLREAGYPPRAGFWNDGRVVGPPGAV